MKRELLTAEQLENLSTELPDWDVASNGLERTFEFGDFVKAFSFMSAVALHAGPTCTERCAFGSQPTIWAASADLTSRWLNL